MGAALLLPIALWLFSQHVEQKKTDAASLSLVPVDFQVNSLTNMVLKMQIVNPSESDFTIDSLAANIYYQNQLIGSISKADPFTIKKTDTSIVAFTVTPQTGAAIASLITILLQKDSSKTVTILGSYKYLGIPMSINKTISLNV